MLHQVIKHVYTTLMMLWSSFITAQNVQSKGDSEVLDLQELKIVKPSDIR